MADLGTRTHPTGDAVARCREALAAVTDTPLHLLETPAKADLLREIAGLESQTTALKLRLIATSGDVAAARGHRDVATWLAHETNTEPARLRSEQATAHALDERWSRVARAMAHGLLSHDQARVIARGLDDLASRPDLVPDEILRRAETELVGYGTGTHPDAPDLGFSPRQLRTLADRILHVVAPEIADEDDARHLERLERAARQKTKLTIKALGGGITRISGIVPDHIGIRLRTYLDAFTNPRRDTTPPDGQPLPDASPEHAAELGGLVRPTRLPRPRAMGQAFCTLLERLDQKMLPAHGGDATTIILTMELDKLLHDLGTAELLDASDDADLLATISPAEVRRLACTANLVPALLGTDSEVLDLGRSARLFSPAQRRALRLRDRTCRAEGCTQPATWCEAHHDRPWSQGGTTDLANAVTLCSHHHHREHDPSYRTVKLPNGDRRYHRRR